MTLRAPFPRDRAAARAGSGRALIRPVLPKEPMLGGILLSMHNIYYLLNLMQRARQAIIEGRYGAFVSDWMNSPAAVDY